MFQMMMRMIQMMMMMMRAREERGGGMIRGGNMYPTSIFAKMALPLLSLQLDFPFQYLTSISLVGIFKT